MAQPASREQLKEFCLRKLGYPVIQINVDDAQIEDRLDDALQFFAEYHFDGVEKVYIRKQIEKKDMENGYIDLTKPTVADSTTGIPITQAPAIDPDGNSIISVTKCFQLYDTLGGTGMFDARYQIALNDLYGLRTNTYSQSLITYAITRSHMQMLQDLLTPEKTFEFSRVTNKIYVNMDWKQQAWEGQYIMFEAYKILDPNKYTEIYNDRTLKRYVTALIKQQWGSNMMKFGGIELPGGITLNGSEVFQEATSEVEKLENEMQSKWELPPQFFVG
jgi:hypothetical protein